MFCLLQNQTVGTLESRRGLKIAEDINLEQKNTKILESLNLKLFIWKFTAINVVEERFPLFRLNFLIKKA